MQTAELTVYTLQPGKCYEVKRAFQDYYDGGHTVMFAEKTMYLQEEVNRAILAEFSGYLGVCDS
jgi:hypothetical protein